MVAWDIDGDPGLLALVGRGRLSGVVREWVWRALSLQAGLALAMLGYPLVAYGWQPRLLLLILTGTGFALALFMLVGIAFSVVVACSATITMFSIVSLPAHVMGADTSSLVAAFCCGLTGRAGWSLSERLFDARQARFGGVRSLADRVSIWSLGLIFLTLVHFEPNSSAKILVGAAFGFAIAAEWLVLHLRRRRRPFGFLSYRRGDARAARLAGELHRTLPRSTFLDRESIESGSAWTQGLVSALERATVLLALFGADDSPETSEEPDRGPRFWIQFERGYADRCYVPIVPISDVPGVSIPRGLGMRQALIGDHDVILRRLAQEHGLTT